MQSFFSCFSCGQKTSTVSSPKPIPIASSRIQSQQDFDDRNNIPLMQSFDEQKSKTATTITFRTTDTAPSKFEDDQEYIHAKIEQLKKKDLAEKKALEQEFIKQNLNKTKVIYLVEKQWSEEYTKFLRDPKVKNIRQVDNRNLLDQKGRLRNDIREKEDYFIINERIWKFVKALYGGGPDISRDIYFPVLSLSIKRLQISPCGMINPLNFCYMISIIQTLFSIPQLNFYFHKRNYASELPDNKKKPLHSAFNKLVKQLLEDSKKPLKIQQFASSFEAKFNPYEQHDAQEFFLHVANILQEEMKQQTNLPKSFRDSESAYYFYMNSNRSIIDKVFAGQVSSVVQCKMCKQKSITYLPFIDLCLEIRDNTLEGCLKRHFQLQRLDDLYDCEKCKEKVRASKKLTITKTPNYLMIVLKKFSPSGKKIEEKIKYPNDLDVRNFSQGHCGETKFNLLSVIIHKGIKSTKGHYYCYSKRNKKDWYYFNDNQFQLVSENECLHQDAYMLLYERAK